LKPLMTKMYAVDSKQAKKGGRAAGGRRR